jgi:membrane protein YqaA with SNARE-associated domain
VAGASKLGDFWAAGRHDSHLPMPAIFVPVPSSDVFQWFLRLGGIGLIPLGLLDNSIVPVPGSMDVATILLAAREQNLWFYYAAMATAGSVIGGYLTYRLASKGGKEAVSRRFPKRRLNKVYKRFERWGFAAIVIPALLPPPFPTVPFLVAAGALQYSRTKFLAALALGRGLRYGILAYLGVHYGHSILGFLSQHGLPILDAIAGIAAVALIVFLLRRRNRKKSESG